MGPGGNSNEQRRKEIRFDNVLNLTLEKSTSQDSSSANPSENKNREWITDSNQAICLKWVRQVADLEDDATTFHPLFTHQIFGEAQEIHGYKGLRIDLFYTSTSLHTYLNVKWDERRVLPPPQKKVQLSKQLSHRSREENENEDVQERVDDVMDLLTRKKMEWGEYASLSPVIAHNFTTNLDDFVRHIDDPFVPPGELISSYTLASKDGSSARTYQVFKSTLANPKSQEYLTRLQTSLLFFIESANYIGGTSGDDKWNVYLLFERYAADPEKPRHFVVGLCTAYPFWAYPDNERLRISQFIILPPYQRQGHGGKLLNVIYKDAQIRKCLEICVEDPSEDFMTMRDLVDLKNIHNAGYFGTSTGLSRKGKEKAEEEVVLTKELMDKIRSELKIPKAQIRKCYNIIRLMKIDPTDEASLKAYRLDTKRFLFRQHEEELQFIQDPDERKKKLQDQYLEIEQYYKSLILKLQTSS